MNTHRREPGAHRRAHEIHEIHVGWKSEARAWMVTHGDRPLAPGCFRRQAYAVAFARAVAYSRDAEMVVSDANGGVTRYGRETLSYPTRLD